MAPSNPTPARSTQETLALLITYTQAAQVLSVEEMVALINGLNYQDTLQPILDPTTYRGLMGSIQTARLLAEAFLVFRQVIALVQAKAQV